VHPTEPIRLYIPEASPSLNKYAYSHWRVRHADKKRWALMLLAESRRAGATKATGKRRLTIERHGRRKLDPDNLIGGAKGMIDELRALGLLLEDTDNALELAAINVPLGRGQKPHTVLVLQDLTEPRRP
jgi:hypothetical protein